MRDLASLVALRAEWEALVLTSTTPEPTLGPDWLLAWWQVFGPLDGRALRVLLVRESGTLIGLAPLLARRHTYRGALPFRRLELLASGEDEADEICSDYIGLLAARGRQDAVLDAVAGALADGLAGPWDELVMPALDGNSTIPRDLAFALRRRGLDAELEVTGEAPYIPLGPSFEVYLEALPGPRRYLVRRSLRDLEKWAAGTLRIERARTPDELTHGRAILESLHRARWQASGASGAFCSARFRAFHDAVMPALLARGQLDLRWVSVHGEAIAASYNVIANDKLYFYQSGRRPDLPRGLRPGIVVHALAIRDAIAAGLREYDFLNGASRYKRDLALATRPVVRLRAARRSVREVARWTTEVALDQARDLRDGLRRWWIGTDIAPTAGDAASGSPRDAE